MKVLVVDDNADQVATLIALLRLEGFDARGHTSAEKIIACIEEYDPHAVVLDLAMPGKDGLAAASEVRENFPGKPILMIALTGENMPPSALAFARHGFDFYLRKPCDPKALFSLLAPLRKSH